MTTMLWPRECGSAASMHMRVQPWVHTKGEQCIAVACLMHTLYVDV